MARFCLSRDFLRRAPTVLRGLGASSRAYPTHNTKPHDEDPHYTLAAEQDLSKWHSLPRGPLWKGRRGSKEALLVVRELRRAKGNHKKIDEVLRAKVARLLKIDLLAVLNELQRLDEVDLALEIFCIVRQEFWYKPEVYLYRDMLNCLGRNKRAAQCRIVLDDLKREGIKPNGSLCLELVAAYLQHGMTSEAIEVFDEVKGAGGCDKLMYRIFMKGLDGLGLSDLRSKFKKEYIEKFGEEEDEGLSDHFFKV